jgi:hypothetical protein
MSQAREWVEYIKKHPSEKVNPKAWARFKVVQVMHKRSTGFYQIVSWDFEDDSSFENGVVYE